MHVIGLQSCMHHSDTPRKKEMMFLLMELAGDALNNSESEKWVDGINRGGLCTVSDQAYNGFMIIEDLVRKHLTLASDKIEEEVRKLYCKKGYSYM